MTGLFTQPYLGLREDGIKGGVKGIGKGLVSAPIKLLAAAAAPAGYSLKGLEVSFDHLVSSRKRDSIVASRLHQGELDYRASSEDEKQAIIARWHEFSG